ncbi:Crp/Fnr family transcriptional regulator [Porifericola rhodea]|uniref:Crp/Fnr family transcriptional regulator n=1 Tax=Porifericola rhodea TaxID=930972 RepID=UPI002666E91F|nr:Crp/Fnr family transcriptional regulator [Porifericola rhodea]WKN31001.1 Crp/Fnr family transcriptional regulator [Porifericola rhodea]
MNESYCEYIAQYVKQLTHSSEEEVSFIYPHLKVREFSKGDFFLKEGEVQIEMGFICKGLIRRYYINDKGNEISTGFTQENEYVTDYPAFIRQKPSKYFLQCLEPSVIVNLPYNIIQESYRKFKNSEMHGRLIAEKVLTILNDRVEGFLFSTAEERYINFMIAHPELHKRISLTHLSTFLGIERQSLSRIRKRISQK